MNDNEKQKENNSKKGIIITVVVLCVTAIFLGLGISTLKADEPKFDKGLGIMFTVLGGIGGFSSFYLVFFTLILPAFMKFSAKQSAKMIELQKPNIEKVMGIQKDFLVDVVKEGKSESAKCGQVYCKYCGKAIDEDSGFCKYCGRDLRN